MEKTAINNTKRSTFQLLVTIVIFSWKIVKNIFFYFFELHYQTIIPKLMKSSDLYLFICHKRLEKAIQDEYLIWVFWFKELWNQLHVTSYFFSHYLSRTFQILIKKFGATYYSGRKHKLIRDKITDLASRMSWLLLMWLVRTCFWSVLFITHAAFVRGSYSNIVALRVRKKIKCLVWGG